MARSVFNNQGSFDARAAQNLVDTDSFQGPITLLSGSADVVPASVNGVGGAGNYMITTAGVDAIVLFKPTAGADDGLTVWFQDVGGHAHTVTSTGNLVTNSSNVNTATFSGNKGAYVGFRAYNGAWYNVGALGITFS